MDVHLFQISAIRGVKVFLSDKAAGLGAHAALERARVHGHLVGHRGFFMFYLFLLSSKFVATATPESVCLIM